MQSLYFSTNWNGKLLLDCFGTVRLHNPSKYFVGNNLLCEFKTVELGIVKVEAVRTFEYRHITDALAYLDCGKPAHYLASLLSRMYINKVGLMVPTQKLDHIILRYTDRYISAQELVLKDWWQNKIDQQPYINPQQKLFT